MARQEQSQRDRVVQPCGDARQFRVWVVSRPPGWTGPFNARPPRSLAIEPLYDVSFPLPMALALLADFNGDAARDADSYWLVMQPVRVIFGGDLLAGSFID
ncbi:MAG TPA: hypothetical protein VHY20_10630 [Pirellulales bacterium]|jgi:hypothetical protein|nr:hypothetical protein [Pirellulales bacterium]